MVSLQASAGQVSSYTGLNKYTYITDEQRTSIGKYAAIVNSASVQKFEGDSNEE